jgi:hypothetical protein
LALGPCVVLAGLDPDAAPLAGGLLELGGVTGLAGVPPPPLLGGSAGALAGGDPAGALDSGVPALAAGGAAGAGVLAAFVAAGVAGSFAPVPISPILNAPYAAPLSKRMATTAATAARLPPPLFCVVAGAGVSAGAGADGLAAPAVGGVP